MRGARTSRRAFLTLLAQAGAAVAALGPSHAVARPRRAPAGFAVRMVKIGGHPAEPLVREHVAFCVGIGFNALFVYADAAGVWKAGAAPDGPRLYEAFADLAAWCRDRHVAITVSINPVTDTGGALVFSESDGEDRIVAFADLLREETGVRDVMLAFDDMPTELTELRDVVRYGRGAAPAHLDLVRRVARRLPRSDRLWLCPLPHCDAHLGDGTAPYASAFLRHLPSVPRRVGIAWTGPEVIARSVTAADIAATRRRLGGRRVLLYDNYPVNDDGHRDALAVNLGPLRQRDPRLPEQLWGYLACPMDQLRASRLSLLTIADYLADPEGYEPDASWRRAMDRLAGPDPGARDALETQGLEWGGWVGTRNYRHRDRDNVQKAAEDLQDPAALSLWWWVRERYPERMARLTRLQDEPFRTELLETMRKRLAVARALPLVGALLGAPDAAAVRRARSSLASLRAEIRPDPPSARALDLFLEAAGVPIGEIAG